MAEELLVQTAEVLAYVKVGLAHLVSCAEALPVRHH